MVAPPPKITPNLFFYDERRTRAITLSSLLRSNFLPKSPRYGRLRGAAYHNTINIVSHESKHQCTKHCVFPHILLFSDFSVFWGGRARKTRKPENQGWFSGFLVFGGGRAQKNRKPGFVFWFSVFCKWAGPKLCCGTGAVFTR